MNKKVYLFFILVATLVMLNLFGIFDFFTLELIKEKQVAAQSFYYTNKVFSLLTYFIMYVAITSLSLPIATVLTLLGSSVFGFLPSLVIISFASSLGATLAFLISRYMISEWVREKYASFFIKIDKGIKDEGMLYLITLRLIPVVPFFIINLTMGLTKVKVKNYYLVSQLGMLPGTIVYVNAGSQLSQIKHLADIMGPKIILSFILIGLLPFMLKQIFKRIRIKFDD